MYSSWCCSRSRCCISSNSSCVSVPSDGWLRGVSLSGGKLVLFLPYFGSRGTSTLTAVVDTEADGGIAVAAAVVSAGLLQSNSNRLWCMSFVFMMLYIFCSSAISSKSCLLANDNNSLVSLFKLCCSYMENIWIMFLKETLVCTSAILGTRMNLS